MCAKERIKEIEENKCVLEKSSKESKFIIELLQKNIMSKESDASHSKAVSTIQGKAKISIGTETPNKFSDNSIILDEIRICKRSMEDKTCTGFVQANSGI